MTKRIKCISPSWDDIRAKSEILARNIINSNYNPDIIIAIARGGLVPAMNLSDILGVKNIASIQIKHWSKTAEKDEKVIIEHPVEIDLSGKTVLIAEDISDTGMSLIAAYEFIKKLNPSEIKTAVIHYVTTSKFKPDFCAERVDRKDAFIWVVYPWNFTEDTINLIKKSDASVEDVDEIKQKLEDNYEFCVDMEKLKKIIPEMKRRGDLKKI
ncbi:MAG: phosphoribosyltransferase [Candidatus Altiarchaeales archaeon HGW-Altiarchaeales-3]|nr:MAG: phosphoribosyltransferase [Candidatus Altiarchaeales archaeon HGW-Altiarchaeales-3]